MGNLWENVTRSLRRHLAGRFARDTEVARPARPFVMISGERNVRGTVSH